MAKAPDPFVTFVLDQLAPLGPVRAKAMFGGWGLYHGDRMFAIIVFDRLWLKVDAASRERFAAAGSEPFVYQGKGKPVTMSYWELPAEAIDEPEAMLAWTRLGLEAALRAPTTRRRAGAD
jgi:DNA transformation protein